MKRIYSSMQRKSCLDVLRNIPDDTYKQLSYAERKIIARALNSVHPQVYILGAFDAWNIARQSCSDAFVSICDEVVECWDFDD